MVESDDEEPAELMPVEYDVDCVFDVVEIAVWLATFAEESEDWLASISEKILAAEDADADSDEDDGEADDRVLIADELVAAAVSAVTDDWSVR